MSTNTLKRLDDVSMDASGWVPTSSFENLPTIRKTHSSVTSPASLSEYQHAKNFILEYGIMLKSVHGLDVSFVEIPLEKEAILSWYNPKTNTLKSITVTDDEDGFEMYLSGSQNGRRIPGKSFKSLNEFSCEI